MTINENPLAQMRAAAPLVHCITNYVAMNITANVLLAAGASPAMVHAPEEVGEFAAISSALSINIGTLSASWVESMKLAIIAANQAGKPWVLDPVAHFATAFRRKTVAELIELKPTLIRGNASEIIALGGGISAGQGVDSRNQVEQAEDLAKNLARKYHTIIAVTGVIDFVTDGEKSAWIKGGSSLMPKVTALGCSLSSLCAAFIAVTPDQPFAATITALSLFATAGTEAGEKSSGPGTFAVRFLDALNRIEDHELRHEAEVRLQ